VRIFCGSGDCPAGLESLAVRRYCTEQLIEPSQERSRHRVAPDAALSASRWPHLARGITQQVHFALSYPGAARWRLRFLAGLSQLLRSKAWAASNQECCRTVAATEKTPDPPHYARVTIFISDECGRKKEKNRRR